MKQLNVSNLPLIVVETLKIKKRIHWNISRKPSINNKRSHFTTL